MLLSVSVIMLMVSLVQLRIWEVGNYLVLGVVKLCCD